jgi:ethanolaminephosphotransferase
MRPYQYRCNDYSILTPAFKRWVITPLINFVPWVIPANIITFISNGIVYFGLYMALHPELMGTATPLLIALTFILYLIGDHLDGMQAKRTKTGSALGEFCDHYLDAFNNGLIMFTMVIVFNIEHKPVVTGLLITSYLAHMAVFYEQHKTGWLTFEPVGSLEGVLLSSLLIASSAIPVVSDVFHYKLFADYSVIELTLIASSLGAIVTFYKTFKRTPDVSIRFWIFTTLSVLVGILALQFFTPFEIFVTITLYCSLYIGRLMQGHLIDGVERSTDYVVPLLLLLLYIPGYPFSDYQFALITVYLSLNINVLIFQTFSVLKVYWVWANARN